ncbi:vitamin K epoxide reductase family protein [Arthrobacter sp. Sr24]
MPSTNISTSDPADLDLPAMSRAKPFGWLLIITGAIAWISSFTLVMERLNLYVNPNASASCDFNSWISCSDVMKTPEAALLGFPNPFIGICAFAVVITVGVVLLAGARMNRWFWICLQLGITAGMALVSWFWFTALYSLAVLCPYCMIVWAMMIPIFVLTTVRNINHGVIPAPAGLRKFLNDWVWVIVGLLYIGVLASIFFRFMYAILG